MTWSKTATSLKTVTWSKMAVSLASPPSVRRPAHSPRPLAGQPRPAIAYPLSTAWASTAWASTAWAKSALACCLSACALELLAQIGVENPAAKQAAGVDQYLGRRRYDVTSPGFFGHNSPFDYFGHGLGRGG